MSGTWSPAAGKSGASFARPAGSMGPAARDCTTCTPSIRRGTLYLLASPWCLRRMSSSPVFRSVSIAASMLAMFWWFRTPQAFFVSPSSAPMLQRLFSWSASCTSVAGVRAMLSDPARASARATAALPAVRCKARTCATGVAAGTPAGARLACSDGLRPGRRGALRFALAPHLPTLIDGALVRVCSLDRELNEAGRRPTHDLQDLATGSLTATPCAAATGQGSCARAAADPT